MSESVDVGVGGAPSVRLHVRSHEFDCAWEQFWTWDLVPAERSNNPPARLQGSAHHQYRTGGVARRRAGHRPVAAGRSVHDTLVTG